MLGRCPDVVPASELGDHSYVAYLTVENVDDYHARDFGASRSPESPDRRALGTAADGVAIARRASIHARRTEPTTQRLTLLTAERRSGSRSVCCRLNQHPLRKCPPERAADSRTRGVLVHTAVGALSGARRLPTANCHRPAHRGQLCWPDGGQCRWDGGVLHPQVEAWSIKAWLARATTGRVSSAR